MTFVLTLLAFLLFALATDTHHLRQLGRRPLPLLKRGLRGGAWAVLAAAFGAAVMARGWVYGPLLWAGAVMLGAGVAYLALNLLPPVPLGRK